MSTSDRAAAMTPEELIAAVTAGLDADEQAAHACPGPAWEHRQIKGAFDNSVVFEDYISDRDDERVVILSDITTGGVLPFVLRFDPVRVLADVQAKREILAEHGRMVRSNEGLACRRCSDMTTDGTNARWSQYVLAPCRTLRALARPYLDQDPA